MKATLHFIAAVLLFAALGTHTVLANHPGFAGGGYFGPGATGHNQFVPAALPQMNPNVWVPRQFVHPVSQASGMMPQAPMPGMMQGPGMPPGMMPGAPMGRPMPAGLHHPHRQKGGPLQKGGPVQKIGLCKGCGKIGNCGCPDGRMFVEGELTGFRYMRRDNIRIGTSTTEDEDGTFALKAAPRVTVGYINRCGRGVRARYWIYQHEQGLEDFNQGDGLSVDTQTLDLEYFETYDVMWGYCFEWSAGFRWNDFEEVMIDVDENDFRLNSFEGLGGIFGLTLRGHLGSLGGWYTRVRYSFTTGDEFAQNIDDNVIVQTYDDQESNHILAWAIGYEKKWIKHGHYYFLRAGFEYEEWYSYTRTCQAPTNCLVKKAPRVSTAGRSASG